MDKKWLLSLLPVTCGLMAFATSAPAASPPCSVDAAAANGERVHLDYFIVGGAPHSYLTWSPAPNNSPVKLTVSYGADSIGKTDTIDAVRFEGTLFLSADTQSNSATLLILGPNGKGAQNELLLRKGRVYNSDHGLIIVNATFYRRWPAGQLLVEAISNGARIVALVRGDAGDVFSKTTYNFESPSQRDTLISRASKMLTDSVAKGCSPNAPLVFVPAPRQ